MLLARAGGGGGGDDLLLLLTDKFWKLLLPSVGLVAVPSTWW